MHARIQNDVREALRSGDKRRVATLRLLLANLQNARIQAGRDLTDDESEAIVRRAVKQRREAIEQYERGGRGDLATAESDELAILEAYLPAGLTDAELEAEIRGIIAEKGFRSAREGGQVMKELMARHKSRVDGRRAQEVVRRLLS